MKLSSNVVGNSNDEKSFPYKSLLTNTQVSKFRKAFVNGFAANIRLSKTQLHKIGQSGGFLGRLLGPLLKTGLPLNVLKPLTENILIQLGLTAASSATDAVSQKKDFGSGRPLDVTPRMTTLIISNEEMNDIMKIFKALEESGLLIKESNVKVKQLKMKRKNKKEDFLILGTLGAILLGNLLTGKRTIRAGEGTIRAGEDTVRTGHGF